MQTGRAPIQHITDSKPKLFVIISIVVISLLALPVILPHITHPSMIYHISLHIISLIIAVFLSSVSILAYNRNRNARMLFMTLGFALLTVIETLYLFHATANLEDVIIPIVDVELSHIILLVMLTLFGVGVLKVNR
jgi:predicted membrane chloride channel (bestrophin family)